MRIMIQRVAEASVWIDDQQFSSIEKGLLVLVGFETEDDASQLEWTIQKLVNLRIFNDPKGVPNLSVTDINGELLIVSQFTLHANTKKGNRPSYIRAARPEQAIQLYEKFIEDLKAIQGVKSVQTGSFGADMKVHLINDGPVTILIDSLNKNG